MSFNLHRAERADGLADVLADILATPLADPFQAEIVAVHSRGIERWLSNRLAARLGTSGEPGAADGVCANLEFPFPGRLVNAALAGATGIDAEVDPWRPERLAWPLLEVIEANMAEPWMEVLARHLGGDDTDSADRDRRFAAVRHIADLFDRYATHRPTMVRAWLAGDDGDGDSNPLPADATWQPRLWRRAREVVGVPSPPERLVEGCAILAAQPDIVDLPARLSLFGLTRLPASYLDVLRALAVHRDIHLLALQPSPAAWSAIAGAGDAGTVVDPDQLAAAIRHPLLRAWGRDSREMNLVLARRLADDDRAVDRHHPVPADDRRDGVGSLLHRLQAGIRDDAPPPPPAARLGRNHDGERDDRPLLDDEDRSLQVHACHGRARQAEIVRDAITHLLAADPTLEPRDVVVMCPDIDELAPLLRAAFDTATGLVDGNVPRRPVVASGAAPDDGQPAIPYRLADRSLRQTNPVLGAVAELLNLVDARLTASQVLAFAALPPVRARFGLSDDELETVASWVESTGTRWGLDAAHRAPYDLAAVDAGTWDAGLQRLLLGVTMSEDHQRLVGGVLPLDDVDSGDIDLAGRVAELIGRLGDVVRDLTDPRPVAGWASALNRAADLLLHTRLADSWQRGQLDRLLGDMLDEAGRGDTAPLRLAEVRDLLADRLRGQPTRAAFRTGDLTMCTLVPMRSVPHRVVCLVGLDDGAFPRGGAPDGDDLLARARHVGDFDRRAEDRQLLLDAVLSAGDALVITYAGRDARTNEVLPPAVPVNELLDVVDATVRTASGLPARAHVVQHHPFLPSDRRCFEAGALGVDGPWGYDPGLLAGARAAAGPRTPPGAFLPAPLPPLVDPVVALDDLVNFVQAPVKAFLRQRLGLSLYRDDDRPLDALVVELDALAAWGIGDRMVSALLAGGDAEAVCAAEIARGLLPPGALGQDALQKARVKAEAIATAAQAVAQGQRRSLEVDVALDGGRRVVGTVPDVVGDVIRATTFSKVSPAPKRRLAAWVRYLAAVAASPERDLSSVLVGAGGPQPATIRLPSLGASAGQRRARALELLGILVDLRDRGLREPLPLYCETSHRYATAARQADKDPLEEAERYWTSTFDWAKEDRQPEHVLVLGGARTFAEVAAAGPGPDEQGPGWAMDEATRVGRLARRLWDPILDAFAAAKANGDGDGGRA